MAGCVAPELGPVDLPPVGFDEVPEISCDAGERTIVATNVGELGFAAMPMFAGFAVTYSQGDAIVVQAIGDVGRPAGRPREWKIPSQELAGDDVHVARVGLWLKRLVVVSRDGHAMRARLYDERLRPTRELSGIDDRDVVRVDVAAHDGKILTAALVRGEHDYDVIAIEHACVVQ